jgi:hypothetical protein
MPKTQREIAREVDEILRSGPVRGGKVSRPHRMAAGAMGANSPLARPHVAHSTKKDYDWDAFADGAAFAFWASPYMSEVENLAEDAREAEHEYESKKAETLRAAYDALSPGSGGQWESVLPETPPSARAVAKKFTKAVKDKLTDEQLAEISQKFSAYDAGYRGAMQSQGEGIGWFDEGVRIDPPRGFDWDTKIHNAIGKAIAKGAREAGVRLPRR